MMCGIIGILAHTPVAAELYEGLVHLQHRGQDMAGILTCDDRMHLKVGHGKANEVFKQADMDGLTGHFGLGHLRYPTRGNDTINEAQPLITTFPYGIGLVHNGNIVNYDALKAGLIQSRRYIDSASDSELLLKYFAHLLAAYPLSNDSQQMFEHLCQVAMTIYQHVEGAYSIIIAMVGIGLFVMRDPQGIRPLVMGQRQGRNGTEYCFASEDVPFDNLGFIRAGDVARGEVLFVDTHGQLFRQTLLQKPFRPCVFEYVYFSRPDSTLNQVSVYQSRIRMGEYLAHAWRKAYPDLLPDVVVPIPFTSNTPAISFAHTLGVRYSEGLYKNVFVGRTFIMSTPEKRSKSVKAKLCPQVSELQGKRVLLLDDSIVRGTTSREIVKIVREAGAKEVYLVSACPPVKFACYYGIDIPIAEELIADQYDSQDAIAAALGVDKLLYQTIPDLFAALYDASVLPEDRKIQKPCMACLDNDYCAGKI